MTSRSRDKGGVHMRGTFSFKDGYTYRMPVTLRNYPFNRDVRVYYDDCRMFSFDQKTDMEALAPLIPEDFEILKPIVSWEYTNCRGVDFMMNGEYRILQAEVPVRFCGKEDTVEGMYPLIIMENSPVPVLGGREEDGMPKVVCDISLDRHMGDHWFAAASSDCETIARMNFYQEKELSEAQVEEINGKEMLNMIGNRCLPAVDRPGNAYQEYILYPQQIIVKQAFSGKGDIGVIAPAEWYIQPSLNQALYALSGLPNYGFENVMRMDCALRLCVSDSRTLR